MKKESEDKELAMMLKKNKQCGRGVVSMGDPKMPRINRIKRMPPKRRAKIKRGIDRKKAFAVSSTSGMMGLKGAGNGKMGGSMMRARSADVNRKKMIGLQTRGKSVDSKLKSKMKAKPVIPAHIRRDSVEMPVKKGTVKIKKNVLSDNNDDGGDGSETDSEDARMEMEDNVYGAYGDYGYYGENAYDDALYEEVLENMMEEYYEEQLQRLLRMQKGYGYY